MSFNRVPLDVALVQDPQTVLSNKRTYGVAKGGQVVSYQTFSANNNSTSQITISCNPPSKDVIVDRRVLLTCDFQIVFTGTGNPLLNLGTYDGLRAFPLQSILNSIQFQIGNTSVTAAPMYQYWPALSRYHNSGDSQDRNYSMTPAYPDQYQSYDNWVTYGSARNPLALQGENSSINSRGGFPIVVVANGNGTATVQFSVTEPIMMSPFLFASDDRESGLYGVQNMSFVATLSNLNRIWSHGEGGNLIDPVAGYAVTFTAPPRLQFKYISPSQDMVIPKQISWPYFNIVSYVTQGATNPVPAAVDAKTAPVPVTTTQNVVQLDGIPRRIYVFAKERDSVATPSSPDTFAFINNITVQFNNNSYLSSATPQQLYDMSIKNGLQMSWPQYSKYCGSVVCINMGEDIGLQPGEAPGVQGQYNLSIKATYSNMSTRAITMDLYVLAVYEGTFSMVNGATMQQLNVLSKSDVMSAKEVQGITFSRSQHVFGGDIFSSIWSGLRSVADKVAPVLKPLQSVLGSIPDSRAQMASQGIGAIRGLTGSGKKGVRFGRGLVDSKSDNESEGDDDDSEVAYEQLQHQSKPKDFGSIYESYKANKVSSSIGNLNNLRR